MAGNGDALAGPPGFQYLRKSNSTMTSFAVSATPRVMEQGNKENA
jgi:hypothetical protein